MNRTLRFKNKWLNFQFYRIFSFAFFVVLAIACNNNSRVANTTATDSLKVSDTSFSVAAQSFGDLQILRYQVPGFNELSIRQKQLAYYLYEAAMSGRDIIYDQKSRNGLLMRKTLETAYGTYKGDKTTAEWKQFEDYCGRFWFSNGNHHHYGNEKFIPACSFEYFKEVLSSSDTSALPKENSEGLEAFISRIQPFFFDLSVEPKLVDLRAGIDNVKASSVNFYEGVTQKEVEDFYGKFPSAGNQPMWGLNSKTLKQDGQVKEMTWKLGGMYSPAIEKIIGWLQKAATVAENAEQKKALDLLVQFYTTGDLKTFDAYSIAWVKDVNSRIDVVNGFIEVYMDPIGKKGSYESVVSMKDLDATKTHTGHCRTGAMV